MVKSDIEIAREAKMRPILEVGVDLGIPESSLATYGHFKAKISMDYVNDLKNQVD